MSAPPPITPVAPGSVSESFLAAVDLHRRGEFAAAEPLYREVLRMDPGHADAIHLWGVARHQQGHSVEAVAAIRRALVLNRRSADYYINLAAAYRRLGRLDRGVECYRQALRMSPERNDVRVRLAGVLQTLARHDEAAEVCRAAIERDPRCFDALNTLGNALQESGRFAEAITAYRRALHVKPDSALALNNLAGAVQEVGRIDEAIALYEQAAARAPNHSEIISNLGSALRANGAHDAAVLAFQRAIGIAPYDAKAHHNLANAWKDLGRMSDAADSYERAIAVDPSFAEAHAGLGALRERDGDADGAAFHMGRAVEIKPLARWRIQAATLLPPIYASTADLVQRRVALEQNVARLLAEGVHVDPAKEPAVLNFYLAYQGWNERDLQQQIGRLSRSTHAFERQRTTHLGRAVRPGGAKIRVGFLSRFFRDHTIGRLFRKVIAGLSREQFEVTVISVTRHDDETARLLRAAADRHVVIDDNIRTSLRNVAALGLDILFYTDLGMEPVSWTLAHSRIAPIQCVTWGHPLTTGLPTIDHFVSSRLFETVAADEHYTERLVRLDSAGICYERPSRPPRRRSRNDFGLPDGRPLYGCLQSLFKLHPDFDQVLAGILRRDPQGEIVLLSGQNSSWDERLGRRFAQTIPDVASRIRFVPRVCYDDFLSLSCAFDVLLDPLYYSGGNTSLEALACGVPIVTLPSEFLRGRITAGFYRRMGLIDCIAADADDYVDRAVRLANDGGHRRTIQRAIADSANVLFEDMSAVRELEEFFRSVFEEAG